MKGKECSMKYEELEKRVFAFTPMSEPEKYQKMSDAILLTAEYTGRKANDIVKAVYSRHRSRENVSVKSMLITVLLAQNIGVSHIAKMLHLDRTTIIHHRDNIILNPFNKELKPFIQQLTI